MSSRVKRRMALWQLLLLFNMLSWGLLSNPVRSPQVGRIAPGRCTTRVQLTVQQKYSFFLFFFPFLFLYKKFFNAISLAVQLTGTPVCEASNNLGLLQTGFVFSACALTLTVMGESAPKLSVR